MFLIIKHRLEKETYMQKGCKNEHLFGMYTNKFVEQCKVKAMGICCNTYMQCYAISFIYNIIIFYTKFSTNTVCSSFFLLKKVAKVLDCTIVYC